MSTNHHNVNVKTAQALALDHGRDSEGGLLERTDWQVSIEGAGKDGKPANGVLRLPRAIGPDALEHYLRSLPDAKLLPLRLPRGCNPSVTIDGHIYTLSIGTRYYRADALRAFLGIKASIPVVVTPPVVSAPADTSSAPPAPPKGKKPVSA